MFVTGSWLIYNANVNTVMIMRNVAYVDQSKVVLIRWKLI